MVLFFSIKVKIKRTEQVKLLNIKVLLEINELPFFFWMALIMYKTIIWPLI